MKKLYKIFTFFILLSFVNIEQVTRESQSSDSSKYNQVKTLNNISNKRTYSLTGKKIMLTQKRSATNSIQTFTKHTIIETYTGAIDVEGIDLDQDGDIDIVGAAYHETEAIKWWENDGNENFTEYTISQMPEHGLIDIKTVDLDQDDDLDILAASAYGSAPGLDAILWYENNGSQDFNQHIIASVNYPQWLDAEDFDGDEDLDLVVSGYEENSLLWFENDGNEIFTRHTVDNEVNRVYDRGPLYGDVSDLDQDGDKDITIGCETSADILWYENDGSGSFNRQQVITGYPEITTIWSVRIEDIDQDNYPDLIAHGTQGLAWLENDGYENFTIHIIDNSIASYYAAAFFPVDMDIDFDIDIVAGTCGPNGPCCSTSDDDLVWFENDGSENFNLHVIEKIFAAPWTIFPIDLDQDRDMDILAAGDYEYEIAWWENTTTYLQIDPIVFLEGPYDAIGNTMTTYLENQEILPLIHPYNNSPWNYGGMEIVENIPEGMVDWVLVQLHDETDPSTIVSSRAAFIKNDGHIVDLDGISPLLFSLTNPGDYYLVIHHRNHLAIMSANPISLTNIPVVYDFTSDPNQYYASEAKQLEPSVWGMFAGDADGNGQIQMSDKDDYWWSQVGLSGYFNGDFNLNGQVQTSDKNDYWWPNIGLESQIP